MNSQNPVRTLPDRPDLRRLKDEARDLVRSGHAKKLTEAQFQIARTYGFPSWPKLKAHVESIGLTGELKSAIDSNDLASVQRLMTAHPELHRAKLGYAGNGPLTWVAECRVPRVPPDETRLAMARWMIENGSDIHQGGDGPLMRAALDDMRIPMTELLVQMGADVNALWNGNYPILLAPCETLAPLSLRWLLAQGADPTKISPKYGAPLSMIVGAYARNPVGKHACLEAFAEAGIDLPSTPIMALHRGRVDLLQELAARDPALLSRNFETRDIFPPEIGFEGEGGAHVTPVNGTTLLHLAIEFDEFEIAEWLLRQGVNPNARSQPDADGFGNQTPLFHTVVCLGRRDGADARLLLRYGADPNARAVLRIQLRDMDDAEKEQMREFRDVTPTGYARHFQEPAWVSEAALSEIAAGGGR